MRISPSQISAWDGCPRAWGYDRLDDEPRREDPSTSLGKDMHDECKAWGIDKTPPNASSQAGRMALALVPTMPLPPWDSTEEHVQYEYGGITYHGFPDARWHLRTIHVKVRDHKSTGDLKWAEARDAETDPQRIIYSYATLLENPGAERVTFEWGYVESRATRGANGTKKHRTKVVTYEATRAEVGIAMAWLHEAYGLPIAAAYEANDSSALRKDFTHCSAYRGCPYREKCHVGISPQKRIATIVSAQSLKDRIAARRKELGLGAAPAANEAPAPTPEAPAPAEEPASADPRTPEEQAPPRRTRGRPIGSKNKSKPGMDPDVTRAAYDAAQPGSEVDATPPAPEAQPSKPPPSPPSPPAPPPTNVLLAALNGVWSAVQGLPPKSGVSVLRAAIALYDRGEP